MIVKEKPVILEVSKNPLLSIAKNFGSITLDKKKYIYIKSQDALILNDLIKKYTTHIEHGKTWQQFLELIQYTKN